MGEKEMYDYLSSVAPDIVDVFSVASSSVTEDPKKSQPIHTGDDMSEEVINLSGNKVVYDVTLNWNNKNESNAGTIFDFWNDPNKANGYAKKFLWAHPTDSHYYVASFRSGMQRTIMYNTIFKFPSALLRVFGKLDAQYYVGYTGESGDFTTGATLTDSTSGATATIEAIDSINKRLFITGITGAFSDGDSLTDGTVTATESGDQTALY